MEVLAVVGIENPKVIFVFGLFEPIYFELVSLKHIKFSPQEFVYWIFFVYPAVVPPTEKCDGRESVIGPSPFSLCEHFINPYSDQSSFSNANCVLQVCQALEIYLGM